MGMSGHYLRVSASELEAGRKDPDWLYERFSAVEEQEDVSKPSPREARHFNLYKAWDVMRFLFDRAGLGADAVFGAEGFTDEDWGYGPPRLLPAARVCTAASELAGHPWDELTCGVTDEDVVGLYPNANDETAEELLGWASAWYPPLVEYFAGAAESGDAIVAFIL